MNLPGSSSSSSDIQQTESSEDGTSASPTMEEIIKSKGRYIPFSPLLSAVEDFIVAMLLDPRGADRSRF
jgi:hypothetical protein